MDSKRRCAKRGSVSSLLMMLFLSFLLLVSSFVNAAGYFSGKSYADAAVDLAGRSVLAEYIKPLRDSYGIFAIKSDVDLMKTRLYFFANGSLFRNPDPESGKSVDALRLAVQSVHVDIKAFSLLDISIFEKQILEQMKFRIPDTEVSRISGLAEELDQGAFLIELTGKAVGLFQEMNSLSKILTPTAEAYKKINEIEAQMRATCESVLGKTESPEAEIRNLKHMSSELRKNYEIITFNFSRLKSISSGLLSTISEFDYFLTSQKSGLIEECAAEIIKKVGDIKSIVTGMDMKANQEYSRLIQENVAVLESFEDGSGSIALRVTDLYAAYNWTIELAVLGTFLTDGKEDIAKKEWFVRQTEKFSDNIKKAVEKTGSRILKNESILNGLPTVEFLSSRSTSDLEKMDLKALLNLKKLLLKGVNTLMVNEYILTYMTTHQDQPSDQRFFHNEAEYIVFGSFDDEANYNQFKMNYLVLRASLNILHLYSDPQKRSQIVSLAAGITPGPWALCTEFVIATAWAALEAENDLRIIEEDGKVSLLKTSEDWAVGFGSLLNGSLEISGSHASGRGLTYKDYLRLFLMLENREEKLLRIMDLIQINLKGVYDENFMIKDCCCGFYYHSFIDKKSILPQFNKFDNKTIEIEGIQSY